MALWKSAQVMDIDDEISNLVNDDEVILYDEKPSEQDVVELHQPETVELSFKLPHLPGCEDAVPMEVSTEDPIEVLEEDEGKKSKKDKNDGPPLSLDEVEAKDPWDWQAAGVENFIPWVHRRMQMIPRHTGQSVGIERAIAYLKKLNSEISKAVSTDIQGKIDIAKLEGAREEIHSGIERLEDASDRMDTARSKKRADRQDALVKEAQKATHVGGIVVTVPIFISRLARIIINGVVSGGKDVEDLFDRLVKKHALKDREQAELMQLLFDMNYPVRRDRGYNTDELIDQTSSDQYETNAKYFA